VQYRRWYLDDLMLSSINPVLDIMPLLFCAFLLDSWRRHSFPELHSFFHDGIISLRLQTAYTEISLGIRQMN
jgi:hypothetical protein